MEKFKELQQKCKCSVLIEVNGHRDYYQSVKDYMDDANMNHGEEWTDNEVLDEMIKRDTIVWVQAYPDSPVGFYTVYHYDVDMAMDLIIELVNNN